MKIYIARVIDDEEGFDIFFSPATTFEGAVRHINTHIDIYGVDPVTNEYFFKSYSAPSYTFWHIYNYPYFTWSCKIEEWEVME